MKKNNLCSLGLSPHSWKREFFNSTTEVICTECSSTYYKKDLEEYYHNIITCPECGGTLKPIKLSHSICKNCGASK